MACFQPGVYVDLKEDGGGAVFRPVPGLRGSRSFPTAYAVGYFLPLYELEFRALPNPNSYVPHPP